MELIILLIKLLAKLGNSGQTTQTSPSSVDPQRQMEIARQIQQRIEEARRRAGDPNAPMMARIPPPGTQQRAPQKQSRKQKRQAPPPLPVPQQPVAVERQVAQVAPPLQTARPVSASADAKQLSRWLRPQTLRTQFILTEVFQPPLSLRE